MSVRKNITIKIIITYILDSLPFLNHLKLSHYNFRAISKNRVVSKIMF